MYMRAFVLVLSWLLKAFSLQKETEGKADRREEALVRPFSVHHKNIWMANVQLELNLHAQVLRMSCNQCHAAIYGKPRKLFLRFDLDVTDLGKDSDLEYTEVLNLTKKLR